MRKRSIQRSALASLGMVFLVGCAAGPATSGSNADHKSPVAQPSVSPSVFSAPAPCRPGWSVASGAVPTGDHRDSLVAIAGSAYDDVWAVGDRLPNPRQVFPLLEHWDGRRWAYFAGASLGDGKPSSRA